MYSSCLSLIESPIVSLILYFSFVHSLSYSCHDVFLILVRIKDNPRFLAADVQMEVDKEKPAEVATSSLVADYPASPKNEEIVEKVGPCSTFRAHQSIHDEDEFLMES